MEGTGFTKQKLIQKLIQELTKYKTNIEELGFEKINSLFNQNFNEFTNKNELSKAVIDYFSNRNNYSKIFK